MPVISVTYTDSGKSTVRPVNIAIQQKSPNISTGVLAVDIHQSEPVTDKVQGRQVRAGIYLGDELLSNHVQLKFTSESDDPRERFVPARMACGPKRTRTTTRTSNFGSRNRSPIRLSGESSRRPCTS